jgi:hypothetical protein
MDMDKYLKGGPLGIWSWRDGQMLLMLRAREECAWGQTTPRNCSESLVFVGSPAYMLSSADRRVTLVSISS